MWNSECGTRNAESRSEEMMLYTGFCPRSLCNCEPRANIVADDGSSFICCGESNLESRTVVQDRFRVCFYNEDTDTMYDHDEIDLIDLIAVLSDALAFGLRNRDDEE